MQTTYFRNKLNLYWRKTGIVIFLLSFLALEGKSQSWSAFNKSGSDDQLFSYGFFLAAHTSTLRTKYSEAFLDPDVADLRNVRSIMPVFSPGFSLGFLLTTRMHDQVNILFTPKVGFYEHRTDVDFYTDDSSLTFFTEETLVELPLLLKYKSQRFNNTRMFFIGGLNPQFRTKKQEEADEDDVVLIGRDVALEFGMGFDLYFKFFKFSPEIRFSHGLSNLYKESATDPRIAGGISDIRRKSITLYLNFQ